jgi:hypothetical protein
MATKKPVRAKSVRRTERKRGLTSAIGPKATTALVICVLAGGLVIGDRLRPAKDQDKTEPTIGTTGTDTVLPAEPAAPKTTARKTAAAVPASPDSVTTAAKTPFVTVAGCLQRDSDGFRLKDTSGADAPKSRSWKSGFLKKGSASIDVVDPTHAVALADYVGRRVSITGTLAGREMKVQTVRRMAPTCE